MKSIPCFLRSRAATPGRKIFFGLVSLLQCAAAFAAGTDTWVGNTSLNWNTAANWTTAGGSTPPAAGDSLIFGAAGTAGTALNNDIVGLSVNNININGAGVFTFGGNALTLTGVLTDNAGANETISLAIGGSGSLVKSDASALTLSGANTFSGPTTINRGNLTFSAAGNVSGSALTVGQVGSGNVVTMTVTPTSAGTTTRSAGLTWNGGPFTGANGQNNLTVNGTAAGHTIENFGVLTLNPGPLRANFAANAAANLRAVFSSVTRSPGSAAYFNRNSSAVGSSTNSLQVVNQANLVFTTPPTLVGGGGTNGSPAISIVPWADINQALVTYDADKGLRPLATTERVNLTASGQTTGQTNCNLATVTMTANQSVNSLFGSGTVGLGGNTLTVASGTIIATGNSSIGSGANDGVLAFGSAEGHVFVENTRTLTINSVITGSGGLTVYLDNVNASTANLVLAGDNTFTGITTVTGNRSFDMNLNLTSALALQNSTLDYNNYGAKINTSLGAYTLGGLKGAQTLDIAAKTLTVGSAGNSDSTIYSGVLSGAGGNLTKDGAGYFQITTAPTFTGDVTANAGRLTFPRSAGSFGAVTANSGATLGITFNGNVTNTSVTLNPGSTNTFDLVNLSSTTIAPWTITSSATADGASNLLNVVSGQFAVGSVYPLVNYSSASSIGGAGFKLGSLPVGVSGVLTNDTANGWLALRVTNLAPTVWSGAVNTNWDIATTANWTIGGSPATFANGAAVNFNDSASGTTTVNLISNATVNGIVVSNTAKTYTIGSVTGKSIGGTGGLTKSGNNTLTLSNLANTYTGPNTVNGGTLVINADGNLGAAASTVALASGTTLSASGSFTSARNITIGQAAGLGSATVDVASGQSVTLTGVIDDGGFTNNLVKTGSGTLTLTANNTLLGNVTVNGGTLVAGTGSGARSELGSKTQPGRSITVNSGATLTFNDNNVTTGAPADVTPALTVNGGKLNIQRFNASGLTANGNTLLLNNAAVVNVDDSADGAPYYAFQFGDLVTVAGAGGSVITAGAGASSKLNLYSAGTTFDVAVTGSAIDFAVATPLMDEGYSGTANPASLIKNGAGSMIVSGASEYTGPTTVNAGKLIVTRAAGSAGDITVADGADFGIVFNGPVTNNSVTLGVSSGCTFEMGGISSTNVAALNASSFTPNGSIALRILHGSFAAGKQYPLVQYGSLGGGGFAAFTSLILPSGISGSLVNNTGNNSIDLLVSSVTPNKWTGAANGNWDIASTANWTSPTTYSDGQAVLFDDTATGSTTVNLIASVIPNSVIVSNITKTYVLGATNSSAITGNATLTKNGSGTLVLTNMSNTYSGGTVINVGTVVVNNANSLGATSGSLALGGTLNVVGSYTSARSIAVGPTSGSGAGTFDVASGQTLTLNGVVANNGAGTGALTKSGAGTLVLGATKTYTGTTLVSAGTLSITTLQQQGGAYSVSDGATLTVTASPGASVPMSSLTLGSAGVTTLNLGGVSATTPMIRATNFTANGTVTINVLNGSFQPGTSLQLVKYNGSIGGSSTFNLGPLPLGVVGSLSNDTANLRLVLNITGVTPLVWKGTNGPNWDIATTTNWIFGGTNVTYADGAAVLINDSGANSGINIAAAVSPAIVTISNSSVPYTFSSSTANGISGATALTKFGTNSVTYGQFTNSYTGGTVIGGGTIFLPAQTPVLVATKLGQFGAGTVTITNNTQVQIAGTGGSAQVNHQFIYNDMVLDSVRIGGTDGGQHLAGAVSIASGGASFAAGNGNKYLMLDGVVSGSGPITIPYTGAFVGAGGYGPILFQNGANTYSGTVTLNNGVIGISDPDGTALANATVNLIGKNATAANPILWAFTMNTYTNTSLMNIGNTSGTLTLGALSGGLAFNLDGGGLPLTQIAIGQNNANAVYSGVLSGSPAVIKVGTGTQALIGANAYSGDTTVSNGTLVISTLHGGSGSFNVSAGKTLAITNAIVASAQMASLNLSNATTLDFQNVSDTATPMINANSDVSVTGTATVKITGTSGLVAGNVYPLVKYSTLSGAGFGGLSLSIPGGISATLTNDTANLWVALHVVSTVNTAPTNITSSVSGNTLNLSWPGDHLGWTLQSNAVSVVSSSDWHPIAGSAAVTNVALTIDLSKTNVFFRLVYP